MPWYENFPLYWKFGPVFSWDLIIEYVMVSICFDHCLFDFMVYANDSQNHPMNKSVNHVSGNLWDGCIQVHCFLAIFKFKTYRCFFDTWVGVERFDKKLAFLWKLVWYRRFIFSSLEPSTSLSELCTQVWFFFNPACESPAIHLRCLIPCKLVFPGLWVRPRWLEFMIWVSCFE